MGNGVFLFKRKFIFQRTGSVIITLPLTFIKTVECPSHTAYSLDVSFNFAKSVVMTLNLTPFFFSSLYTFFENTIHFIKSTKLLLQPSHHGLWNLPSLP